MAAVYYHSATIFMLAGALLFAASNPYAEAQNVLLNSIAVTGRTCCSVTGECISGAQPANGAGIGLNCTKLEGTVVQVAQTTTNPTGNFNVSASGLNNINALVPCTIKADIQDVCPEDVLHGAEESVIEAIGFIDSIVMNSLGGQ